MYDLFAISSPQRKITLLLLTTDVIDKNYSKSRRMRTYLFESQDEIGLISKVLRLISRYGGSYLRGESCSPLESLTKISSPIFCFGSILMDLISNGGGE